MTEFRRGQSVYVVFRNRKKEEGFIKAIPGDTYLDSDGETVTLVDKYWVKSWYVTGGKLQGYPEHKSFSTCVVSADRLQPRN